MLQPILILATPVLMPTLATTAKGQVSAGPETVVVHNGSVTLRANHHSRRVARARCAQSALRAVPHQEAFAEAKSSALRALAMDSGSADAQVALGTVLFLGEWDWVGAERSLRRAMEINPDHTETLLHHCTKHSGGWTRGCGSSSRLWRATRDHWCSSTSPSRASVS
jgi:hypothetical protein